MRLIIAVLLLSGFPAAYAETVTIDFSDPALPESGLEEGFETQGFQFTFYPVPIPSPPAFYTGDRVVFCPDCNMAMERVDGTEFGLIRFDAQSFPQPYDLEIAVTGYLADGGTMMTSFALTGAELTYELNWDGLLRVEFDPNVSAELGAFPTGIDDIVVNVVPIPAAVWLFGSALAGLGWMRRKQGG